MQKFDVFYTAHQSTVLTEELASHQTKPLCQILAADDQHTSVPLCTTTTCPFHNDVITTRLLRTEGYTCVSALIGDRTECDFDTTERIG